MAISPEETFIEFTKQDGTLTEPDIKAAFDKLQPVKPDVLIGEWKGDSLDTGHPAHARLKGMNWLGKTFHSTESVDPIVIDKGGRRACDEDWGHARLRQIEFRGVQLTAMVYDNHPIIDHLRRHRAAWANAITTNTEHRATDTVHTLMCCNAYFDIAWDIEHGVL